MTQLEINKIINNIKYREKNNFIEGRITINNHRKSFYGKTKTEIKNKIKQYLQKFEYGYEESEKIILNEVIEKWLTEKRLSIEPSSYTRLKNVWMHQIYPNLGTLYIGTITKDMIQSKINAHALGKEEKALAKSGLEKQKQLLNMVFNYAIEKKLLTKNPVSKVVIPKETHITTKTKLQTSLNEEEVEEFKQICYKRFNDYKSRDAIILLIMLNLGLRAGEMLALEWNDFNFKTNTVSINKTLQDGIYDADTNLRCHQIKKGTKTGGTRILSLNEVTLKNINLIKEFDANNNIKSQYFVCTTTGKMQNARNFARSLYRVINDSNITKTVSLHTLRHTFGSLMLYKGVPIEVVSKLMGHANIKITYDKYIHVLQEIQSKTMLNVSIL